MQYVSRHSTAARRGQPSRLLPQTTSEYAPRYTSAIAGLPSLGGGDLALPATYRVTLPTSAAPVPARPARRDVASGLGRALVGLGMGSMAGLSLGALICAAIVG